jgi:ElaB/YqjD/DUF883 family membrane-anchored ribosome-binding protein
VKNTQALIWVYLPANDEWEIRLTANPERPCEFLMRTPSVLEQQQRNSLEFCRSRKVDKKERFMEETNGPEKIKAEAKEGIEGIKENASAAVDATRHAAEAAWSKAKSLQSTCEAYVREKPIQALLVTLGVGVLIGLLAPRK